MTEPRAGKKFKLLKERPQIALPLQADAMIPVPETEIDRNIGGNGEAYELSRLSNLGSPQLVTTERGWPMAACSTHPLGQRFLGSNHIRLPQRVYRTMCG